MFLAHAAKLVREARLQHRQRGYDGDSGAAQAEGLPPAHSRIAGENSGDSDLDCVSVKFKTAERVGPVGEGKSAEAQAIVTIASGQ